MIHNRPWHKIIPPTLLLLQSHTHTHTHTFPKQHALQQRYLLRQGNENRKHQCIQLSLSLTLKHHRLSLAHNPTHLFQFNIFTSTRAPRNRPSSSFFFNRGNCLCLGFEVDVMVMVM